MEWISVKDRLPDSPQQDVWAFTTNNEMFVGFLDDENDEWWHSHGIAVIVDKVTHWMPLPDPPKDPTP